MRRLFTPIGITLLFIGIVYLVLAWNFRWFGKNGNEIDAVITSDGKGYYAYLPGIFLHQNFGKEKTDLLYHVKTKDGRLVNKYTYGTALLEAPFFFGGWIFAKISGYPSDGFSRPFQVAISLAGIFYFLAGLYFLFRLITTEIRLSERNTLFLMLILAFGTTLLYYAVQVPSFSHTYSFFLINAFLYASSQFRKFPTGKHRLLAPLFLSLVFITRPVNILILLFVPFFFKDFKELKRFAEKELFPIKKLGVILFLFLMPVFLQMLLWYAQTGKFFYWSYKGEGFYFLQPHFFDFLFSYKKGLFVYCPILFLFFPSFIQLFLRDPWKALVTLGFLTSIVYVFSSWYCWYYADGFGMRPMMEFFGVFFLLFAFHLNTARERGKRWLIVLFFLLAVPVNLIFTWQHHTGIFHPNAMDGKKFWTVFLRTGESYQHIFGGARDAAPYAPFGMETLTGHFSSFDDQPNGVLAVEGKDFPHGTNATIDSAFLKAEKLWVRVTFKMKVESPEAGKNLLFVAHALDEKDSTLYYCATSCKEYPNEPVDVWQERILEIFFANPVKRGGKLGLYFWNKDLEKAFIDDVRIELQTPREEPLPELPIEEE
jgi:hypothetical protein